MRERWSLKCRREVGVELYMTLLCVGGGKGEYTGKADLPGFPATFNKEKQQIEKT